MRVYRTLILSLPVMFLALLTSACVRDNTASAPGTGGQPVVITLDAGSRATNVGDAADSEVSALRVLIYDSRSGRLAFNIPVAIPTPATLKIATGIYDFVFVANEASDAALAAKLAVDGDIDNIGKLRALFFARGAFGADTGIPMATFVRQVEVAGDNKIKTPDMSDYQTGMWDVRLDRVGIRLKLVITMTALQYGDWVATATGAGISTNIGIGNIPGGAYVLPGIDNSARQVVAAEAFAAGAPADNKPGLIAGPDAITGDYTVTYDRLILPETFFTPVGDAAKALTLGMTFAGGTKTGAISAPDADGLGYTLPRNTYLLLNATVEQDGIAIQAEVAPWGNADGDVAFDGQYSLKVDNDTFDFDATLAASQTLQLTTDYPDGWTIESKTGGWIVAPAVTTTPAPAGTANIMVSAASNPDPGTRSGSFVIRAGNLRKTIHITQDAYVPAPTGSAPLLYVDYADNNKLKLGRWGIEVNRDNMLLFKFGSVVGFVIPSGTANETYWGSSGGASNVKFDPTGNTSLYSSYDQIPYYPTNLFWSGVTNVSLSAYHNGANIKVGRGDPCMLAELGYNGGDIAAMSAAQIDALPSMWRLPDKMEDIEFAGADHSFYDNYIPDPPNSTTSIPNAAGTLFWGTGPGASPVYRGAWFPIGATLATDANKFLPAAGYRYAVATSDAGNGRARFQGTHGFYWSSTAYVDGNNGYGYSLAIDAPGQTSGSAPAHVYPVSYNRSVYGFPIRCVQGRQRAPRITPVLSIMPAGATSMIFDSNGSLISQTTNTVTVMTNQPGWTTDVTYNQGSDWLSVTPTNGSGNGTFTVDIVSPNETDTPRTATITVNSTGGTPVSKTVTVVEEMDFANIAEAGTPLANTYSGAFWRHDQTGERIIIIRGITPANAGAWSVYAGWYDGRWNPAGGDGILFSAVGTSDPGVTFAAGEAPGNAENFKMDATEGRSTVIGTAVAGGAINFRMGLQRAFSAFNDITMPARYAVVVLSYADNTKVQKIFIRQGEGADFLMRPQDNGAGGPWGSPEPRPDAVRFSPYNIKDPADNEDMTLVTAGVPDVGIALRGGAFVDYPSQAGYMFRWNYSRQAFAPHVPGAISAWTLGQAGSGDWDPAVTETCPAGYHRPYDGPQNGPDGHVDGSEMRQSLWLNPQTGRDPNIDNSIWGYYADGFFDRRQIENGPAGSLSPGVHSSVSVDNNEIAHTGRLFYNPATGASLFFPAAGYRNNSVGALRGAGVDGFYWSASSISATMAWRLDATNSTMCEDGAGRSYGFPIRCVR